MRACIFMSMVVIAATAARDGRLALYPGVNMTTALETLRQRIWDADPDPDPGSAPSVLFNKTHSAYLIEKYGPSDRAPAFGDTAAFEWYVP